MMSLCAIILGLVIAIKKLRTFHIGRPLKVVAPAVLLVHMDGWVPQRVPIHTGGTLPFLGITHDLDLSGKSQYARATADLTHALEILAHSRASPACVLTVLRSSTISKVAYSAVLSPWSLTQLQEFDRLMAVIFRRLSSNMRSSQLENLFQPACKGGLGFPQPSAIFLERKQTVLERMPVVDMHTRLAVEGLQHRAHLRYDGTTPCTSTSRGLYMSAILAYAAQADIVRLAPCPLSAASELHTAVHSVGRLDKTAHRFCALHHIATVADLTDAQPDGVRCWSTRFHIPSSLQALLPLNPPHGSRPLCAGQFWRISPPLAPGQLLQVNDTIVELVEVPPYPSSAPIRYHLWHIPPLTPSHLPPNSPITRPSFTLGPPTATAHFDHLFPPSHLHHLVHVQPSTQACSFSSILLRRTLLALPEPRPHLPSPPIAPSPPSIPTISPSALSHIHIFTGTLHHLPPEFILQNIILEFPLLHIYTSIITLEVSTDGSQLWSTQHYAMENAGGPAQPTPYMIQSLMLLAAVEKGTSYPGSPLLSIYTHNKGLADTLTKPPRHHRKLDQLGSIHRSIRRHFSARMSLIHSPSPGKSTFTEDWDTSRMGSFLAAHLALPVPDTPPAYFELPTLPHPSSLADLLRSLALTKTWSWSQERTGHPILAEIKPQVAHVRRTAALVRRDVSRAGRNEPAKWSVFTTIPYAASCLRMVSASIGRRGLCERIGHERHWTVGNNRAKGIQDPLLRAEAARCTLCGLPDSSDHWIRECQHEGMAECRLDFNNNIQDWTDQVEPEAKDLAKTLSNLSRGEDGYRVSIGNWPLPLFIKLLACPSIPPEALARATLKAFAALALGKIFQLWQIRSGLHGRAVPTPITFSLKKPWFYAVRVGGETGIFQSASESAKHTHKFTGAQHKRFRSREEAQAYLDTPTSDPYSVV